MEINARGYNIESKGCSPTAICDPMNMALNAGLFRIGNYNDKHTVGPVLGDAIHVMNLCPWCGFMMKNIPGYIQKSDYKVFSIGGKRGH